MARSGGGAGVVATAFALLAGCSIESGGLAEADGAAAADTTDTRSDGAPPAARDSGPMSDVAATDAGRVDAGPRVPTALVDVAMTGAHGAHPAVVWDGAEFVVGLVVADMSGDHIRVLRLPPGVARAAPLESIDDGGPAGREDVTLAPRGADLAVGWSEPVAGERRLVARIVPDEGSPSVRYRPLVHEGDRDDAHLFLADGEIFAAVRAPAGGERFLAGSIESGPIASPEVVAMGNLGETSVRATSRGPTATFGSIPAVATRRAGTWERVTISGLVTPHEGDAAEMSDGSLLTVWLHRPDSSGPRVLAAIRLDLDVTGWEQRGSPVPVPMLGPDPALGAAGAHALLAANLEDGTGGRQLALVWLDAFGAVAAGPCPLPSTLPFSNDPDIACGDGWCAIVWLEGTSTGDTDFITRVVQVPADPAAPCP